MALDEAGVPWIEAGVPAMGEEEQKAMQLILSAPLNATVFAWNRARREDILASVQCGFSFVHISVPVSELHIRDKLKTNRAWVLRQLEDSVRLAKSFGCTVSVGAEDSSRASIGQFLELADLAAKLGAVRIRYADTIGCLEPFSVYELLSEITSRCPLPVEFHAHNDFGLATANTLAACQAGAELVSTTVAGIGERAGNASMEEVVKAMYSLYGCDTRVDRTRLNHLKLLVADTVSRIGVSCAAEDQRLLC